MEIISSTEKGDNFEAEVFSFITGYVDRGQTFINPQKSEYFTKKGYYSHRRKKKIIVDISIETHSSSKDRISLLTVIECKNLNKKVPVDDVEEFIYKLGQIAGKNVKGMMFSKKGFSSGAFNVADSEGIALARLLPHDEVDWILERTPKSTKTNQKKDLKNEEIKKALTSLKYRGQSEAFFSFFRKKYSYAFQTVFNNLIGENYNKKQKEAINHKKEVDLVPYIGQEEIEARVKKLISFFSKDILDNKYEVNVFVVLEYLAKNHDVKYNFLEDLGMNSAGKEALGSIKIDEKIILISKSLIQNTPRWRFTLAHEIGHFLLHRNLDIPSFKRNHFDTDDVMNWEGEIKLNKNMMRLEWQANTFASSLLLPKNQVYEFVILKLQKMGVRNFQSGVIFLDEQWCNIQAYQNVLFSMKKEFNVSYQVINYRLAQLGILKNQSKLKRVNEIMKGSSIFEGNKL